MELGGVHAVADHEHVRRVEAEEVEGRHAVSPVARLGQQRAGVHAGRAARRQEVEQERSVSPVSTMSSTSSTRCPAIDACRSLVISTTPLVSVESP